MTPPRILVRERERHGRTAREAEPAPELGWRLLGGLGAVFALVAGADILLAWYPTAFNNSEWKFGTVTTTLNSFPLLAMGLVLLMGAGLVLGRRRQVLVMTLVFGLMTFAVLVCAALYLPEVSNALSTPTDPAIKVGVQRAVVKTVGQLLMYGTVFSWMAFMGYRHARAAPA